jgi:hypothetical protein
VIISVAEMLHVGRDGLKAVPYFRIRDGIVDGGDGLMGDATEDSYCRRQQESSEHFNELNLSGSR